MNQATTYTTIVLMCLSVAAVASGRTPVAFISDSQGSVRISKSDEKEIRKAYVLEYLFQGDRLQTGPESRAVVVFTGSGRQVELQQKSLAVIGKSSLDVRVGESSEAKATVPLPAVSALSKMSTWVTDSSQFTGIVLRSQDTDREKKQQQAAEKRLREICSKPEARASDFMAWAAVLVELGQFKKAVAALERATKLSPSHPRVHTALAWLHNHLADNLRALDPDKAAQHEQRFLEHLKKAAELK